MERLRNEQIDLGGLRPGEFGGFMIQSEAKKGGTTESILGSPEWLLLNGATRFDPRPREEIVE